MNNYEITLQKKKKQLADAITTAERLQQQIRIMQTSTKLKISDHALVRYLQRVEGLDTERIIASIISPVIIGYYSRFGDGTYPIDTGSNIQVVIKDATIVTIIL